MGELGSILLWFLRSRSVSTGKRIRSMIGTGIDFDVFNFFKSAEVKIVQSSNIMSIGHRQGREKAFVPSEE